MFERIRKTFGGGSRPPRLDTSGGPIDAKVLPVTQAGASSQESPRREQRGRSPGGSPGHAHTRLLLSSSHPKSPVASKSPRFHAAVISPRQSQPDPELVGDDTPSARAATAKGRGQVTRGGGRTAPPTGGSTAEVTAAEREFLLQRRPGRASPERTAGSVEESAARQLKEASSFWLVGQVDRHRMSGDT